MSGVAKNSDNLPESLRFRHGRPLLVFCQEAHVVIWNRRDPGGLAVNLAIAVAVAALANGFVYFMNPAEDLAPPTGLFSHPAG